MRSGSFIDFPHQLNPFRIDREIDFVDRMLSLRVHAIDVRFDTVLRSQATVFEASVRAYAHL